MYFLKNRIGILVCTTIIVLSLLVAGCSSPNTTGSLSQGSYTLAPLADMPVDVQNAPVTVKQAYQFAAANPDILTQLPCYCGCGGMGHTSNYSCYISGEDGNAGLTFDSHALGCSICVDITQDAMRMLDEGKSIAQIRIFVDQEYSRFGPSNMP